MASKFDQPDAPDTDRYEDKPIDVADLPDDLGQSEPDAPPPPLSYADFLHARVMLYASFHGQVIAVTRMLRESWIDATEAAQRLEVYSTALEADLARVK